MSITEEDLQRLNDISMSK